MKLKRFKNITLQERTALINKFNAYYNTYDEQNGGLISVISIQQRRNQN